MKNILFVSYGGGHIKIVETVAREMLEHSNVKFKVLALTSAYGAIVNKFPDGVVKKLSDYSFLFDDVIDDVIALGLEFLDDNYSKKNILSKEETIFYIGFSFYDLIKKNGRDKAYRLYENNKRQSFLPVQTIEKILKYEKVDTVVSTTSPRFEQASLIAGNNLGINTVEILDLFSDVHPLPAAEHIVVMNNAVKAGLVAKNLKNKKYYVLGQPAIEKTVNNVKDICKEEKLGYLGLDQTKKILLFATQRLSIVDKDFKIIASLEYEKVYDELFKLLNELSLELKITIIVRLHPNEKKEDYDKYFDKYPLMKYSNKILNLEESLAVSDFVLTKTSTVAIEAAALNKKVFTYMHKYDQFYSVPMFTMPPFVFSNGMDELKENLSKCLGCINGDNLGRSFLPKNSAQNIAKLIKKL